MTQIKKIIGPNSASFSFIFSLFKQTLLQFLTQIIFKSLEVQWSRYHFSTGHPRFDSSQGGVFVLLFNNSVHSALFK